MAKKTNPAAGGGADVDADSGYSYPCPPHHWQIDSGQPGYHTSWGICIGCGAVKEFANSIESKGWDEQPGSGRAKKQNQSPGSDGADPEMEMKMVDHFQSQNTATTDPLKRRRGRGMEREHPPQKVTDTDASVPG